LISLYEPLVIEIVVPLRLGYFYTQFGENCLVIDIKINNIVNFIKYFIFLKILIYLIYDFYLQLIRM
jgi:hypothetical protein